MYYVKGRIDSETLNEKGDEAYLSLIHFAPDEHKNFN
jgi:hypothetical protein